MYSECYLDHVRIIPRPPARLNLSHHHYLTMGYIHVDVHRAICLVQSTGFCLVVFQLLSLLFIATTMLGPSWWQHHPVWARHYLLCPALGSWWGSTLCSQGEHLTFQPGPVCFWGPSSAVWPRASVFITPPGAPGLTPRPVYHKDSFAISDVQAVQLSSKE